MPAKATLDTVANDQRSRLLNLGIGCLANGQFGTGVGTVTYSTQSDPETVDILFNPGYTLYCGISPGCPLDRGVAPSSILIFRVIRQSLWREERAALTVAVDPTYDDREAVSVGERIDAIRVNLSFTMAQLADILHVSRPTLYSWKEHDPPNRSVQAVERLIFVSDIADRWRAFKIGPLGRFRLTPFADGASLGSLLQSDRLDSQAIGDALEGLRQMRIRAIRRKRDRGYRSVASVMEKFGFPEEDRSSQEQRLSLQEKLQGDII